MSWTIIALVCLSGALCPIVILLVLRVLKKQQQLRRNLQALVYPHPSLEMPLWVSLLSPVNILSTTVVKMTGLRVAAIKYVYCLAHP
jgi:hypothetical protein